MGALTNYRTPPRLIIAPNHAPWHADEIGAGLVKPGRGEIFKGTDGACADPGTQNFPCHGDGAAGGQGHSLFSSN